jgi:hypothetical protein
VRGVRGGIQERSGATGSLDDSEPVSRAVPALAHELEIHHAAGSAGTGTHSRLEHARFPSQRKLARGPRQGDSSLWWTILEPDRCTPIFHLAHEAEQVCSESNTVQALSDTGALVVPGIGNYQSHTNCQSDMPGPCLRCGHGDLGRIITCWYLMNESLPAHTPAALAHLIGTGHHWGHRCSSRMDAVSNGHLQSTTRRTQGCPWLGVLAGGAGR